MSNILIIFEVKDNTTDNNLLALTTVLSRMALTYRSIKTSCVESADLYWCDVIIAIRPSSIYSSEIIRAAKEACRFVIISLDDDILNLPFNNPNYWKRKYAINCLELGDVLMSTSQLMLDDYCEKYHLRPLHVNAFVEAETIKGLHHIGNKIRIVYPAGKDHIGLFNKYILPFFDNLISTYSDRIDITFIGVEPNITPSNSVHFVKGMSYEDYLSFMSSHDYDIGIAPLEDNPFCARKYFAKYIEYSRFGILGIYSAVKPYTYVVKDGYNGFLVQGGEDKWEETLIKVIENSLKYAEIVSNSQKDLINRFSLEAAINNLKDYCLELENYKGNDSCFPKLTYGSMKCLSYEIRNIYYKIINRINYRISNLLC